MDKFMQVEHIQHLMLLNQRLPTTNYRYAGNRIVKADHTNAQLILIDFMWTQSTFGFRYARRRYFIGDSAIRFVTYRVGHIILFFLDVTETLPPRSALAQIAGTSFLHEQMCASIFTTRPQPLYRAKVSAKRAALISASSELTAFKSALTAARDASKRGVKFDAVENERVWPMQYVMTCVQDVFKMMERGDRHALYHFAKYLSVSKETQYHHEHFTIAHINWPALFNRDANAKKRVYRAIIDMAYITDLTRPHLSGYLLWAALVSQRAWDVYRLALHPLRGIDSLGWAKNVKADLVLIKSLSALNKFDSLTELFEVEVLVNRGVGMVDWDTERAHRVEPSVVTLPEEFVEYQLDRLFSHLAIDHQKSLTPSTWARYWAGRAGRVPSGSVVSQYDEDLNVKRRFGRKFKKNMVVSAMPSDTKFSHFISRAPMIYAKASKKVEWGKQRAIYGADITSYVMTDFAFGKIEKILEPVFPIGQSVNNGMIQRTIKMNSMHGHVFTSDYEDFNSQHSFAMMKKVIEKLVRWCGWRLTPEQRQAADWVVRSIDEERVVLPTGEQFRSNGTLLSGWRLTTFMNTVLNWLYATYMGFNTKISLHSGDDALIYVNNLGQVVEALKIAKDANIRIQPAKTCFGGEAEFLRQVTKDGSTSTQYLARGIATLVHSRIESEATNDIAQKIEAIKTRTFEVLDRVTHVDEVARSVLHKVLTDAQFMSLHYKTNVDVELMHRIYIRSRLLGGIEEGFVHGETRIATKTVVAPEMDNDYRLAASAVRPGIVDLTQVYLEKTQLDRSFAPELQKALSSRMLKTFVEPTIEVSEVPVTLTKLEQFEMTSLHHVYKTQSGQDFSATVLKGLGSAVILGELIARVTGLASVLARLPSWMGLAAKLSYAF